MITRSDVAVNEVGRMKHRPASKGGLGMGREPTGAAVVEAKAMMCRPLEEIGDQVDQRVLGGECVGQVGMDCGREFEALRT